MRYADEYGFYELNPFPGCNQIVVSNHAFVYEQHRGKGIGTQQHAARLNEAARLGYDLVLCTVKADNAAEITILKKCEWKFLHSFKSTETGNELQLWCKNI